MTPSIDQTLHQFANLWPNWTLLPILTLLPNFGGFHRTLQRVRLANRGRLLLWTPGPVPFWACICSNVETILSWTCDVYGPFEFRASLGTSILPSINRFNHTSWLTVVTPTDRPKPIRNRCVIEDFGGIFVLSLCFLDFSVSVRVFAIVLFHAANTIWYGTFMNLFPCEDAGGLSREYVLRIPHVS